MTFLNPAVLLGLLAASIPVIIHLFNLRKLKKVEFSTLKFLNELQKNKIRRVKLKQLLLLALRTMIILLLVTAFARPTLEGVSIGGTTSAAKTTAVFILDDTFSMSVIANNGSYFNQAKQTIKKLVNRLEEGDEAALVLISGNKENEIDKTTNLKNFIERVDVVNVSDATGTINNAIIRAADIISQSKNFNKEVYLLSDFQKNRIAVKDNITNLSKLLDERVRLYTFNFSGKDVFNTGISEFKVETQIFEKNKPVSFTSEVTNYSNEAADNLVVSLFLDGERSAQQSINLKPGETGTVKLDAGVNATGFVDAVVSIEDDDILNDNRRYTTIYIPEKIRVLLAYENEADIKFVKLALLSGNTDEEIEVSTKKLQYLNSAQLNDVDVLFIIGNDFQSSGKKLEDYIKQGNGVVVFPASKFDEIAFKNSVSKLLPKVQLQLIKAAGNSDFYVDFNKIDFNHPVFQNIFRKKKKEIESPKIFSYYKVKPTGSGQTVIELIDGSSFLSEYEKDKGKLLLFNISPVLSWSDFPLKSIFAPLVYKSAYFLYSNEDKKAGYIAGEPFNINVSKRTLPQIKIVKPNKEEEYININNEGTTEFISYSKTYETGIYKIYSGDKLLESISVNFDPAESVTKYMDADSFDSYLSEISFGGSHINIDLNENITQVILQARFGSELWRYFLLAAFILAVIEMTIARSAKKELAEIKE